MEFGELDQPICLTFLANDFMIMRAKKHQGFPLLLITQGTGNVGAYLRFEPDQINTYLSRDGGLTWVEAHKGAAWQAIVT